MSELLPCPFCGSTNLRRAEMYFDDDGEHEGIECADRWNQRPVYTVNLNDRCTVVLRRRGVEAIQKHFNDLGPLCPCPDVQVGDEYSQPLWEIMNIFGPFTYMGPEPPFDTQITMKKT